ncbi:MAG: NADH-quinone oxidoreductase subunit N [Ardenticatenales bacterium]|nr:NADH-quinone oxidoreductase subunit N [Ardenticatenales bacterium]
MEFTIPEINLIMILPVVIVLVTGILILVFDLVLKPERKNLLSWLSLAGMFVALVQAGSAWGQDYATFIPEGGHAMIVGDNYSHFLNIIFLLTGIITILISNHYIEEGRVEAKGEYYMLLLFSISGMMLMGMANDLILVFVALEMLSIPLYILCAFARPRLESEESAMKYFLLGAFSSGFLVFGIALIYGATGATALPDVLAGLSGGSGLGLAGVALLLVGFGFKVAVVPFHSWTPDVYEGAPTVVTAFMSVGAKVGGFAAMMRVFMAAFPNVSDTWIPVLAVLSALTMIVGNVAALGQQNIKRMLAYSSIAHAGYIMMAVAAGTDLGISAALFYMFAYLFTNMGAFALVAAVERRDGTGLRLEDYKGLAKRHPVIALVLAYFMLSLTGIPPSGGFTGKFFVFQAAMDADLLWLTVVGVVTTVVSGYFYLRVVFMMFMFEGEGMVRLRPALGLAVFLALVGTLLLGFAPGPWYEMARQAVIDGATLLAGG